MKQAPIALCFKYLISPVRIKNTLLRGGFLFYSPFFNGWISEFKISKENLINTSLILAFCFFISSKSFSQNIVPNWSFEDTVSCPSSPVQINAVSNWASYRGTPDYFHSCSPGTASVPTNLWGYQQPANGNAYAGIVTYASIFSNYREFIGVQLNQPLIIGQKYFISISACKAVNSSVLPNSEYGNIATNNIGIRFLNINYSVSNPLPIDNISHFHTSTIISDTLNWTRILGSFNADSAYGFLCIGNFFNDSLTNQITVDSTAFLAYYYLDEIKVSTDSAFVSFIAPIVESESIKIFPNPFSNLLYIEGSNVKQVVIINMLGEICLDAIFSSNTKNVDCSRLSNGLYICKIVTSSNTYFKKIIHK